MLKQIFTAALVSSVLSLQALASGVSLGKLLDASEHVRNFVSSSQPLEFAASPQIPLEGGSTSIRWFFYKNSENPGQTFGDMLKAENKLGESFQSDKRIPGALFIKESDQEKARGIFYTLSINQPVMGEMPRIPTIGEVVKKSDISHWKPSEMVWPAAASSIVTVDGVRYQVRYCKFNNSNGGAGKDTIGAFVQEKKLQDLKPIERNNGYGVFYEYNLDPNHGPINYPQLVISFGKVN